MAGGALDSIGTSFSKNPASQNRYPNTASAKVVATTMKRRDRRNTVLCLVPGNADFRLLRDFSGRLGVPNNASLTRTRLASQEKHETCFQLIEEG